MAFPTKTSAYEMDGGFTPSSSLPPSQMSSGINSAADAINRMNSIAEANNAYSANQAKIQRDWQEKQNAKAMKFNASEAAKNRDWQKMMSDTAHQREIADLKAAGLNPVLSATGGNGASVGSGATASGVTSSGAKGDTDMSMNSALVNLLSAVYNRTTQIEAANINARTQEAVADKYNATSEIVAQIAASASMFGAKQAAGASRYSSDTQRYISQHYPSNEFQAIGSFLAGIGNSSGASSARDKWNSFNAKTSDIEKKVKNWYFDSGFDYVVNDIKSMFTRKK